ncbi:MAG TPA: GNAT family N-acetyltransferase [Elusimicrobiota bacterium]|jgi:GNAT superfamily N-acetyltransferase|nr:GNAT family N-acetyltransferase [Elusimicrobiota bacterium]
MNIWTQRAGTADWPAIESVCARTGLAGSPVEEDERGAFVEHWIRPYRELRPDWTWIAVCDKAVIGYLTGCPDTPAFEKERRRVYDPAPDSRDFFPEAVRLKLWAEHPGHLMMNVLADYRGMGAGAKLLEAFFAGLKRSKIPSAHLFCGPGAHVVFERLSFREAASVAPAPGIVLRAMTRSVE